MRVPIADVEQVAQHLDRVALPAFAQQGGDRHVEVLAEQVEQRRFDGGDGVDGGAQVEGLQPAAAAVAIGKLASQRVQQARSSPIGPAGEQAFGVAFERARIFSPPGTSPTPVWPALSRITTRLRVKNGAVRAAQIEQHAVVAGDWDAARGRDSRRDLILGLASSIRHRTTGITPRPARRRRSRLFARWVRIAARAASLSLPAMASRIETASRH